MIFPDAQGATPTQILSRHLIADQIERLLCVLDAFDGDADFEPAEDLEPVGDSEPSLGWSLRIVQHENDHGADHDRELDTADDEPSWGISIYHKGEYWCELELDPSDAEPSLGWFTTASGGVVMGATEDLEEEVRI